MTALILKVFLIFIIVCDSAIALEKKPESNKKYSDVFIWQSRGRDAVGRSLRERFQVNSDGSVFWTTQGSGSCPKNAGVFTSSLKKESLKKIFSKGYESILKQQEFKNGNEVSNSTRLTAGLNGKRITSRIKRLTENIKSLEDQVLKIKRQTKGQQAISMSVNKLKDSYKIIFSLIGDKDFTLLFPQNAKEAFNSDSGIGLEYKELPKKYLVVLSKKNPSISVSLKKSKRKVEKIWYENRTYLHHANRAAKIPLMELSMCGVL